LWKIVEGPQVSLFASRLSPCVKGMVMVAFAPWIQPVNRYNARRSQFAAFAALEDAGSLTQFAVRPRRDQLPEGATTTKLEGK
jgi:hypothetical protein